MNFSDLVGLTLSAIECAEAGSEEITLHTNNGASYKMYHDQNCCESVSVNDVEGDIADLIGQPLVLAEEASNEGDESSYGSCTWTFYRLATAKGFVVIRWFGESNGYYSEEVSFRKIN